MFGVPELFASMPPWLGTLPNWITASGVIAGLTLLVRRELGLKKLSIEAARVTVESRKVDHADEADLRNHWAEELQRIRDKMERQEMAFQDALDRQSSRHNDALTALEERHNRVMFAAEERQIRCETERERLAERVTTMMEELRGVREQVRMTGAETLILWAASGEKVPPAALAAAKRIVERQG